MDRKRKIQGLQNLVDQYPDVKPVTPVAPQESVWDTVKRTKQTLVDKPFEGLRIKQKSKARQWKSYRDEIQGILRQ